MSDFGKILKSDFGKILKSDFDKTLKSDFGKIPKIRWLKSDGWVDSVTLYQVIIFVDFLPFNIGILDNSHPFNVHRIFSNYP